MKKAVMLMALIWVSSNALGQIQTTTSKDAYVLSDYNGSEFEKSKKIKKGSEIAVCCEFEKSATFYIIEYKKEKWYIKQDAITINAEIEELFKEAEKAKRGRKENKNTVDMNEWGEKWERANYGKWYNHVKQKQIAIGMPEKVFLAILKDPKDVFVSKYSSYTFKRYTYSNLYIDTVDGVIDSFHYTE